MQLRIDQRVLLQMLYRAQGIVDKKSTLNVLAHVLLESVGKDAVRISCTDYDVGLLAVYPAEILEPGSMAINGKSVFDVVKTLGDGPVEMTRQPNHWVEIRAGRSEFKLAGIPPEDFPEQKDPEELPGIVLDRSTLCEFIDKTAFSVSTDESRMNLNGAYFRAEAVEGDATRLRVSMVSTDGHRLSHIARELTTPDPIEAPIDAIVHRKGIQELKRILEGEDESVHISSYQNNMVFRYENAVLFVRQIEDSFPEYEKVIPKESGTQVLLDRRELLEGVRRTATLSSAKVSIVKFSLEDGKVVLTTNNPEYGEARVEIDVDYSGKTLVVGFNHRYVLDVLGVLKGEKITFKINDEFSPGVIECEEDPGATFVIMPMRI